MSVLLNNCGDIKHVFVMTDDYAAYREIEKGLEDNNINVFSFVTEYKQGYDQKSWMGMPVEEKHKSFLDFLIDIEIAKNSVFFMGSQKSNIFRLVHYLKRGSHCFDVSGTFASAEKNRGPLSKAAADMWPLGKGKPPIRLEL